MNVQLYHGDCVAWARDYSGEPFHALLCDPPYHMTTVKRMQNSSEDKEPGSLSPEKLKANSMARFFKSQKGFMGQTWDGGDVAFNPETWAAFLPLLYPGAFGMAFAGSRGWHRLAVAIEDAGFVIHPSIFGWAYGSGFPKATRVNFQPPEDPEEVYSFDVTGAFAGHRYGLQALKPALEPIIVFQKPYEGRPIDNIALTGAGVLNVDRARISYEDGGNLASNPSLRSHVNGGNGGHVISHEDDRRVVIPNQQGRWPANFYLDEEAARRLDEQSGNLGKSSGGKSGHTGAYQGGYKEEFYGDMKPGFGDSGGASRFFFRVQEQIDEADPVRYVAKASRSERDAGLDGFDENPAYDFGSIKKSPGRHGENTSRHNVHPTVKPIALAKYLATLLLPPAEYTPRRLFVPFAGVASECIGAMQAGWEHVTGVELTEEYLPIARARVEYWQEKAAQQQMVMPL